MKESMYLLTYETDKGSERYILKRGQWDERNDSQEGIPVRER